MSYVEVFAVEKNGDVVSYDMESKNNHGFAPLVWRFLNAQYNLPDPPLNDPYGYNDLWNLYGKGRLERKDEILLGATLLRVWVPRKLIPELIEAMMAFHQRYIVPRDYVETIKDAAGALQRFLEECPEDLGVAFNMCSAEDPYWVVREDGERRPYNIFRDGKTKSKPHWELVPSV